MGQTLSWWAQPKKRKENKKPKNQSQPMQINGSNRTSIGENKPIK